LYALKADLPAEIKDVSNVVNTQGSAVVLTMADGVVPRFYAPDPQHFTLDVDLTSDEVTANQTTAEEAAKKADEAAAAEAVAQAATASSQADDSVMASNFVPGTAITPQIDEVSGTVRVSFPFDRDTPSAVFRRGDTLWMLFDTPTPIKQPGQSDALSSIASAF